MNPFLTLMPPSAAGWLRSPRTAAPRREAPLPDIVIDETMLYRSECFAEDLQAASDAALADLFPMLRTGRAAAAGR
jgi:hypothetical protein